MPSAGCTVDTDVTAWRFSVDDGPVPDVLLVTGPAGAGKTVAASAWAETRTYPCAHASLDEVRSMVKSGYADPRQGWNRECREQLVLARGSIAMLARRFRDSGMRCVVDDAVFPEWIESDYAGWKRELDGLSHQLVVLLPTLEATLARDKERPSSRQVGHDLVETIYEMMTSWRNQDVLIVDNSTLSVDDTVHAIDHAIARRRTNHGA